MGRRGPASPNPLFQRSLPRVWGTGGLSPVSVSPGHCLDWGQGGWVGQTGMGPSLELPTCLGLSGHCPTGGMPRTWACLSWTWSLPSLSLYLTLRKELHRLPCLSSIHLSHIETVLLYTPPQPGPKVRTHFRVTDTPGAECGCACGAGIVQPCKLAFTYPRLHSEGPVLGEGQRLGTQLSNLCCRARVEVLGVPGRHVCSLSLAGALVPLPQFPFTGASPGQHSWSGSVPGGSLTAVISLSSSLSYR